MLRDGHVDGLATGFIELLVLIGVDTSTCELQVVMASSRCTAARNTGLHEGDMSLSSLLTYIGRK